MFRRRFTATFVLLAFLVSPTVWAHVAVSLHPVPADAVAMTPHSHHQPADAAGQVDVDIPAQTAECCHAQVCSGAGASLPCDAATTPPLGRDASAIPLDPLNLAGLHHPPPLKPPR